MSFGVAWTGRRSRAGGTRIPSSRLACRPVRLPPLFTPNPGLHTAALRLLEQNPLCLIFFILNKACSTLSEVPRGAICMSEEDSESAKVSAVLSADLHVFAAASPRGPR
ncbi:hypothetical protein SKAU_G00110830 [Synaphobranchus kaupii]|uniref:Uncharacterized protein n=1 Tax=Synaphobranchus kaupii TaxID=118154 RepID=A0A9Q1J679_SYNKA|nr:hypothetical protein SKAU_G00110830 [Synaphobranchus kaupii]